MEKAVEFCLPNQDGIEVSLKSFLGKNVIVYFYPKDDTSGCTKEACDFSSELETFEKLDAVVIGISPDNQKSHKKFIEKYDLKVILLSDEKKEIAKKYGVEQKKYMYGKEFMDIVRTTFLIDKNGFLIKKWDKVKVDGHIDAVKEELEKLKS